MFAEKTLVQEFPAFAQPLMRGLADAQVRYNLFPPAPPVGETIVIVAVSGGPDSVCLLHALHQVAPAWRLALHVAHLDHALRPESAEEAAFVGDLAAKMGLPFHTMRADPDAWAGHPGGQEDAARRARYRFLHSVATSVTPHTQTPVVAVAHHMNDQAETLVMNLVRGSGVTGLSGMPWKIEMFALESVAVPDLPPVSPRTVQLVRPLLGVPRNDVMAYTAGFGLEWRQDGSNLDTSRLRNRIRRDVLPHLAELNPQIVSTLARTATLLASETERIVEQDRNALTDVLVEADPPGIFFGPGRGPARRIIINLDRFLDLNPATQRGVIRMTLNAFELDLRSAGFEQIESLIIRMRTRPQAGGPYTLMGNLVWTIAADREHSRVSLHRADELPFLPEHPYLQSDWRSLLGELPLISPGNTASGGDWLLNARVLSRFDLPRDWIERTANWQAFIDNDSVSSLMLTTPKPGMRFAPLGMFGQHKSLGDFFTDKRIPTVLRDGWPILVDAGTGQVVWVCGITVAHTVRIHEETRQVLWLAWQHEQDL